METQAIRGHNTFESIVSQEVLTRAANVTLLIMDVDGVLSDGRIIYDEFGDELKCFDVQDGAGLVFWRRAGFKSAIITGRKARLVKRRAKEMQVDCLIQKTLNKLPAYDKLLRRFRVSHEQVCAMGDDLMELPILRRAGLAVAVPDAVPEVKTVSHYTTTRQGGRGAVRETIELLLKAKGVWDDVLKLYQV